MYTVCAEEQKGKFKQENQHQKIYYQSQHTRMQMISIVLVYRKIQYWDMVSQLMTKGKQTIFVPRLHTQIFTSSAFAIMNFVFVLYKWCLPSLTTKQMILKLTYFSAGPNRSVCYFGVQSCEKQLFDYISYQLYLYRILLLILLLYSLSAPSFTS